MKRVPRVGDRVLLNQTSNGLGRLNRDKHADTGVVDKTFTNFRVRTKSGDVWKVIPANTQNGNRFGVQWVAIR